MYYTGQHFNIPAITQAAQRKGCYVGWDMAHAIGNVPLRLNEWGVEFAAWCNYKHVNAGPGCVAGMFLFLHSKHASNSFPKLLGWWGHKLDTRFDMNNVMDLAPGASGYRLSTLPLLLISTLMASLDVFEKTSMDELRKKSQLLTGYLEFLMNHHFGESSPFRKTRTHCRILTPPEPERRGAQLSLHFSGISGWLVPLVLILQVGQTNGQGNVTAAAGTTTTAGLLMPLYVEIPLTVMLVVLSGLFSGLNIGLMARDTTELELIMKTGSEAEKRHARAILPVREQGNYLLCSILLGNTLVNTVITLFVDNIMESTLPETMPDAAKTALSTILPTLAIIFRDHPPVRVHEIRVSVWRPNYLLDIRTNGIDSPNSLPIAKMLDWILGKESKRQYGPPRLMELVKAAVDESHSDSLSYTERRTMDIILGAARLETTTVGDHDRQEGDIHDRRGHDPSPPRRSRRYSGVDTPGFPSTPRERRTRSSRRSTPMIWHAWTQWQTLKWRNWSTTPFASRSERR